MHFYFCINMFILQGVAGVTGNNLFNGHLLCPRIRSYSLPSERSWIIFLKVIFHFFGLKWGWVWVNDLSILCCFWLSVLYSVPLLSLLGINISVDDSFDVYNGPKAAEFILVIFFLSCWTDLCIIDHWQFLFFILSYLFTLLYAGRCN